VEVIIALKNYCEQQGVAPPLIDKFSETVAKTGRSVMVTSAVNRKRKELGLEEIKDLPVDELEKILE
jgi:heterodisulfide reductase subunit C